MLALVGLTVLCTLSLNPQAPAFPADRPQIVHVGPSLEAIVVDTQPKVEKVSFIVNGRVLSPDQVPVESALVCGYHDAFASASDTCTNTTAGGYFSLALPHPGNYRLAAEAPNYAPTAFRDGEAVPVTGPVEDVVITLAPGGVRVDGVVLDKLGGAVEGARVIFSPGHPHAALAHLTTSEGRFSLWTRPGPLALRVDADGYAPGSLFVRAPTADAIVSLYPEATISGKVSSTTSSPANCTVAPRHGAPETQTSATGEFSISGLLPGEYLLRASCDGAYGEVRGAIAVGIGDHVEHVEILVVPAFRVTGVIRTDTNGLCSSGQVHLREAVTNLRFDSSITHTGEFGFQGLPGGTYHADIECPGFASAEKPVLSVDSDLAGVVWTVNKGLLLLGEIAADEDSGRELVEIRVRRRGMPTLAGTAVSTRHGEFKVEGLNPGEYEVTGHKDGWTSDRLFVKLPSSNPALIHMSPAGRVVGRVLHRDHSPASHMSVVLESAGEIVQVEETDGSGSFTFLRVGEGDYTVKSDTKHVLLKLSRGDTVEMELVLERAPASLRGIVVGPDAESLADAIIIALPPGVDFWPALRAAGSGAVGYPHARTDETGGFVIEGMSPGHYRLEARHIASGLQGSASVVIPARHEVHIAAQAQCTVSGEILTEEGNPYAGSFSLLLTGANDLRVGPRAVFSPDGAWQVNGVQCQDYQVSASAANGSAHADYRFEGGAPPLVRLQFRSDPG